VEGARAAAAADVERLAALVRELADELAPMRGGSIWRARDARTEPLEAAIASLLDRGDALVVAGTIDDAIVGVGAAETETLHDGQLLGRIMELYVEPSARGVGVGEAMTELLVSWCTARGCVGIDAFALPGHRTTKNFFEGSGFTARGLIMHHTLGRADNRADDGAG
jgi:GNAT superfamily N-acetyltransferase